MGMANIAIEVDDAVMVVVDRRARATNPDHDSLVRCTLEHPIAEQCELDALIQEGSDSVETEPVISQHAMESWFAQRLPARANG